MLVDVFVYVSGGFLCSCHQICSQLFSYRNVTAVSFAFVLFDPSWRRVIFEFVLFTEGAYLF